MEKQQIHNLINDKHASLIHFLSTHDDQKWNKGPEGKWATGQHIVHLTQSTEPLNKALKVPKLILQYKFGKANRPCRSYDEVVKRYLEKLAKLDGKIVSPYSNKMPKTPPIGKEKLIAELTNQKNILLKRLNKISEKQLDKYLIPHPAMGRMIMREIIMWSAYHTEHHHKLLRANY
jgi:hypothetical protein